MALLTAGKISRSGLLLSAAAADVGGDRFSNTGNEFVYVKNGSGGGITVTLDIQKQVDGQSVTDPTVALAAGEEKLIGPFPTDIYNDGDGEMNLSYDSVTSVTVAVLKL